VLHSRRATVPATAHRGGVFRATTGRSRPEVPLGGYHRRRLDSNGALGVDDGAVAQVVVEPRTDSEQAWDGIPVVGAPAPTAAADSDAVPAQHAKTPNRQILRTRQNCRKRIFSRLREERC
jgi:hypothetical protein